MKVWRRKYYDFYSHAPRGARQQVLAPDREGTDFYSHAPRGARPGFVVILNDLLVFLLTRPSRGATGILKDTVDDVKISTHTPLAGRDQTRTAEAKPRIEFLLTRPSRGAT